MSSPGAGKTMFLEKTLGALRNDYHVAALVGDLATDNDAQRLARADVPVKQITTGTTCHLEAEMIRTALAGWSLADLDVLFIENVGNLVCPATYDLGENLRLVLFSVTEGEDKPLKYPTIFNTADLAVITKADLAAGGRIQRGAGSKEHPDSPPRHDHPERLRQAGRRHEQLALVPFLADRRIARGHLLSDRRGSTGVRWPCLIFP